MHFKDLKMKIKLLLSFSLTIVLLVVTIIMGATQINTITSLNSDVYNKDIIPMEALQVLKTNFADLRRIFMTIILYGTQNNSSSVETSILNADKQLLIIKESGDVYLDKLAQANASKDEYDAASHLLSMILGDYREISTGLYEHARNGDDEEMFRLMSAATATADVINIEINDMFDDIMNRANKNILTITDVSMNVMYMLVFVNSAAIIISIIIALLIGNLFTKQIVNIRKITNDIANGNLCIEMPEITKDEVGDLTRDMVEVINSLNNVTNGLSDMTDGFISGEVDVKIDSSNFVGKYKEIAEGINKVFSINIGETLTFLNSLTEIAHGNFDATIAKLPGKKIIMNESFDSIKTMLISIAADVGKLAENAASGNLSERINSDKYRGDWAKVMSALNRVMECVATPIHESKRVLELAANGNFNEAITGDYQGSFLDIKESVNGMLSNIGSYILEISNVLSGIANNDLNQQITREYVGQFSEIKDALNNIISKLNDVIGDISIASSQVADGAKQISDSGMILAQGATEQASAVEELNATIALISQNTSQNAENAIEAKELSEQSKNNADKGSGEMLNMLSSMEDIKESSNSISKIIKVIDDIAFQTNLLALNAAVEAARAGTHGKGFAVVAEEVRNLAGRSQNAAKETSHLIEESINRVNEGTKIADTTAQALNTIVGNVTQIASLIANIANSSQEQASAIKQVTEGLVQITEVVQHNSATSEESASASQQLTSQSEKLQNMVDVFVLKQNEKAEKGTKYR